MPRYEFKDGKSEKFWEIQQDGDSFTVRYGRLGTDGQSSTKVFPSEEKASKETEKVTASKVKKGYVLVGASAAAAPEPDAERNQALEAMLFEQPDDPEAWAVYADALGTDGDPRGELISLSLQPPTPEITARMQAIEEEHQDEWMGPTLRKLVEKGRAHEEFDEVLRWTWQRGFLVEARLGTFGHWQGPKVLDLLRAVLKCPSARFLRKLVIGLIDPQDPEGILSDVVLAIAKVGKLHSLRHLHIGDFEYPVETEISWTSIGNVDKLYPVTPNLETLHIQGGGIGLRKLAHPRLKRLKIETGGLSGDAVRSVAAADLPELEELEVWFGADEFGGSGEISMLAPIFAGKRFPKLRNLGLKNCEFTNEMAVALVDSAILHRIERLDLSMGTLSDTGGRLITRNIDKFQHLKGLDLSNSYIGLENAAALQKALGDRVDLSGQDEAEADEDCYVDVGE
jgi:uncharacterized protein (TIGR02996 family)